MVMGHSCIFLSLAILFGVASLAAGGWQSPCGGIFSTRRCRLVYEEEPHQPPPPPRLLRPQKPVVPNTNSGWARPETPKPTPGWERPTQPPPPPPNQEELWGFVETCSANFITQEYKEGWEELVDSKELFPKWNIRLASKLHIYLMALNLFQTNGFYDFNRNHWKESCFTVDRLNKWTVTNTTGYGAKSINLRMDKTNIPKLFRVTFPHGPAGGSAGTASIILSDNISYVAFEFCLDNGLRTFAVFTTKDFSEYDLGAIQVHLRSLGFKQNNMVDLNPFINCHEYRGELFPRSRSQGGLVQPPVRGPPKASDIQLLRGIVPSSPYYFKKK